MRRNNMPRGNRSTPNTGPLMTDHLKLQDLDLELELLKRKREMIEHQQQILVGNQQFNNPRQKQFEYGFNQPHLAFQGQQQSYSSDQNFSRYYNDPPVQQLNNFGGSLLGKRPGNDSEWQPHSAPKRFSGPQGGAKRKFGAGPSPKPAPRSDALLPQPLMRQSGPFTQNNIPNQRSQPWNKPPPLMGQKSGPRRPPPNKPLRKDLKPKKVAKTKQAPSACFVNKLISYPIPQRRAMIEEANKANLVKNVNDSNIESFTLRPNVVPSQQLVGRLELALGQILKDIKTAYGDKEEHKASFVTPFMLRKMKQSIRERLRTVMMNKHVGKVSLIVEQYRAVFPPESDSEIVQFAQDLQQNAESQKHFAIRLVNADSPEEYFKTNMDKLVGVVLDDMFGKIESMYKNESLEKVKKAFMDVLEKTDGSIAEDFTKDVDGDEIETKDVEMKEVESEDQKESTISNTDEIATKTEENVNNTEESVTKTEENVTETEENVTETEENAPKPAENVEKFDDTEVKTEKKNEKEAPKKSGNGDKIITYSNKNKGPKSKDFVMQRLKKLDGIMCSMIKRKLPQILPKYKTLLLNVLNVNEMYATTSATINLKLEDKLSVMYRMKNAENLITSKQSVETTESKSANATPTPQTDLYYVKILGRPVLPKRKVMQTFLQQYKPKSIKKHRHMHLLFVGFANKEDFDKIVALKETIIGNATISIIASEKTSANGTLDDSSIDKDELKEETTETSAKDISISSELDDQIDDLLSSIRKEEEKAKEQEVDDEVIEINEEDTNEKDGNVSAKENTTETSTDTEKADKSLGKADGNVENGHVKEVAGEEQEKDANAEIAEKDNENASEESKDKVEALKNDAKDSGRATPTRTSSRLANVTPSTIRTRRASRLAQN